MFIFIVGFIVGVFASFLAAIGFEKFKTPNLEITVGPKTTPNNLPGRASTKYSFLHLNVSNKNNWLKLTNPALSVRAKLYFKDPSNNKELFSIDGRWSGNPEPYTPMSPLGDRGTVNPTIFPVLRKIDIFPGQTEGLDVAIKYDDENPIYAFSNESYIPSNKMWRSQNWQIDLKKILIDVTVNTGDLIKQELFLLKNPDKSIEKVEIEKPSQIP